MGCCWNCLDEPVTMVGPKPMLSLGFSIDLRVVHPSNQVLIDGRSSRNVNAFSLQGVVDYVTKKYILVRK